MYWFHLKSPAILIDPIQSLLQLFGQFYVVVVVVVVCLFVLFCFFFFFSDFVPMY